MNKCKDFVGGLIVDKFAGTIADTVTVELHDAVTYATIVYRATGVELHQDGTCNSPGLGFINIPSTITGSYYITIKSRNHLETTTATPVLLAASTSYNFTTAATQAFGSNMALVNTGVYGVYVGDVNQDGVVNVTDLSLTLTQLISGTVGYNVTDVTGDGQVNVIDNSTILTSLINGVSKMNP